LRRLAMSRGPLVANVLPILSSPESSIYSG
jgi:hypothetical protein